MNKSVQNPDIVEQRWIDEYTRMDALWIHDGNPKRPHALLRSQNHSNGFFNSRPVIANEELLREAARDLIEKLKQIDFDFTDVDRVVGPQTGATKLAEVLSEEIAAVRGYPCAWASPEKQGEGDERRMVFTDTTVLPGERILSADDVLTTGGSVGLVEYAVEQEKASVLSLTLALVNRSPHTHINGKPVIALINKSMPMWPPEECPLCKQGSDALPAKDNWDKLSSEY